MFIIISKDIAQGYGWLVFRGLKIAVLDTNDGVIEYYDYNTLYDISRHVYVRGMSDKKDGNIHYKELTDALDGRLSRGLKTIMLGYSTHFDVRTMGTGYYVFCMSLTDVTKLHKTERNKARSQAITLVRMRSDYKIDVPNGSFSIRYVEKIADFFRVCIRVEMMNRSLNNSLPSSMFAVHIYFITDGWQFIGMEAVKCEYDNILNITVDEKYMVNKEMLARLKLFGGI